MPPEIQELMQQAEQLMQYINQNGASLNSETQQALAAFLQETQQFIEGFNQTQVTGRQPFEGEVVQTVEEQPPSSSAQLLWILAGQNEDVFVQYLHTYPDPAFRTLLNNPSQLDSTIEYLTAMMPPGEQPVVNGIPHADINSSNIWGMQYDPKTQKLKVRFQGGAVYGYDGVPPNVFQMFENGAVPAKTKGQNQYGRWWQGKNPSLGAAFHELIRNGGYPYQQLQ